jgi:hypothetical protein
LTKFDYPPDEEREAADLIIKQMETCAYASGGYGGGDCGGGDS